QLQKVKGKWPPYDFFHINSIDQEPNGDFLVSARNTHALYEIDHRTGKIIWRLGGKKSDFRMGKGTVFNWQHDAQRLPNGDISVFDDGGTAYVSWNGATQVATWRLIDASGKRLADAKRRDFETTLSVPKGATRVQAQALDANGTVLGSSKLVSVS